MTTSKLRFLQNVCHKTLMWCTERNLFVVGVLAHYPIEWDAEIEDELELKETGSTQGNIFSIKGGFHKVHIANDCREKNVVVVTVDSNLPNYSDYADMPRRFIYGAEND